MKSAYDVAYQKYEIDKQKCFLKIWWDWKLCSITVTDYIKLHFCGLWDPFQSNFKRLKLNASNDSPWQTFHLSKPEAGHSSSGMSPIPKHDSVDVLCLLKFPRVLRYIFNQYAFSLFCTMTSYTVCPKDIFGCASFVHPLLLTTAW